MTAAAALVLLLASPAYGVRVQDTTVAMPDGVRLAVNVFLPEGARAGERFPAILEYLPYRRTREVAAERSVLIAPGAPDSLDDPPLYAFVRHGYAGVRVDVRGTGRSEGTTPDREYSEPEQLDGLEVIAWIARQPWCDGNVGMWGVSWGGFNSLQMAARQPPALKAILAMHAAEDLFQDDIHYIDGLFHYDEYELSMDVANAVTRAPDFPTDEKSLVERFDQPPWSLIYKRHQRDGPFWRRASQAPPYDRLRIPIMLIGGWLDGYRDAIPRLLQHAKVPVKAIVGPWNHDHPDTSEPGPRIAWRGEAIRWWDRWLKGRRNGADEGPKLAAYVRHWHPPDPRLREVPGEWRLEEGWPPRRLREETLHLASDRSLGAGPSRPDVHRLRYVPSAGVVAGFWWGEPLPDQRPADALSLVYDTAPLDASVEILGLPRVALSASADAPLAHWFVRLSDVAPDGQVTLVTGAGLNGAHRASAVQPVALVPGRVEPIDVELHFTSWVFPKGHRIRVAVSNALWPMIWPTPYAMTTSLRVGGDGGSRLVLPVIPFEERPRPDFVAVPMGERGPEGTWPGRSQTIRDDLRQTTRVEWSGTSDSESPWGRVFDRERLTYEVDDARPEAAAVRGETETDVHLPGRILSWKARLDLVSDRERFHYRLRRELHENGRVIRERTWEETIPGTISNVVEPDTDELLGRFLDQVAGMGLELYPAQEEAILALFEGQNLILNTPTGSGKTLVASAVHFAALARGRRSVYTSPIKALVNEKWMALCRELGPENVGLSTGDATVNHDAPVLCCTAEVLANVALRDGERAAVDDVVMDEFHWYADRDRGVAWQVPLLALPQARFLLMSATLGDVTFFAEALTRLNGRPTAVVKSVERPVPLEYSYSQIPLSQTLEKLVTEGKAPVYVVNFTQKDAADSAQDFTSLNLCTREEKNAVAEAIKGFRFSSPHGPDVRKWLKQGIGVHHAGLLPKYRVLVEQLTQRGLLKVICGTDTLGVGINVPIRTVLFSRLCKFDGQKTAVLSARDFHQIAGRAGRKGFDDLGFVVAQAPEHFIENLKLDDKARGGKKVVKRKPPERNFANWDLQTFKRLIGAPPERLTSRFDVSHGMLLNVLSRRGDGCRAMQRLIRDSHETDRAKTAHFRRAWQLFRALVDRGIVEIVPRTEDGSRVRVNVDLQEDFSMNHALSLYLFETIPLLEPGSETHALDLLTLVESILENPELILRRQLDKLKDRKVAEMKAEGIDYDQRMAELEKMEHPKPLRDFIYMTFNAFAGRHPWVGEEAIRPKSIAREMFEGFRSFSDYVQEYDLERAEGLLLRHLHSVYKALSQTVPDSVKTDTILEMELYLRDMLRQVDSSLLEEWERMRDPDYVAAGAGADLRPKHPEEPPDITRDTKAFTAAIRTRVFAILRAWSIGDDEAAAALIDLPADKDGEPWTAVRLRAAREAHRVEHSGLRLDPEARNLRHTDVRPADDRSTWRVQQMLIDPEGLNDWVAEVEVDLASSRDAGQPLLRMLRLGPLG